MIATDLCICDPHTYYSDPCQSFIAKSTKDANRQWIYSVDTAQSEKRILDHEQWTIVADKLSCNNSRFLLVFKNTNLKTIRDLRADDVPMLQQINKLLKAYFGAQTILYFHYYPSVFQLHLHILQNSEKIRTTERCHFLHHVITNLSKNSNHYEQALILTKLHKNLRPLQIHKTIPQISSAVFEHTVNKSHNHAKCLTLQVSAKQTDVMKPKPMSRLRSAMMQFSDDMCI